MHYFDTFGWYTSTPIDGRSTNIAPTNVSQTITPGELRANFTGYEWIDTPYVVPPMPEPPPRAVPQTVSMRQASLALLDAELLDDVEALVATLPRRYQIEWERASVVNRDNALVEIVRQQKGLTIDAVDDLFINAETYT